MSELSLFLEIITESPRAQQNNNINGHGVRVLNGVKFGCSPPFSPFSSTFPFPSRPVSPPQFLCQRSKMLVLPDEKVRVGVVQNKVGMWSL